MCLKSDRMTNTIDNTFIYDWVALGCVCFTISSIVSCQLFYICNRKRSSVAIKNVKALILFGFISIIHLISVFVSNDHLEEVRPIRYINCPLWNIWLQNVLGLGPWITILIYRLIVYARAFSVVKKTTKLTWIYSSLIMIPIIVISILITIFNGDRIDEDSQTCHTTLLWKGIMWIWIIYVCVLVYVVIKRYGQSIANNYANEYRELIEILFAGIVLFLIYVFVNIAFGFHSSLWRSVATLSICLLHLIGNLRICIPVIYRLITQGSTYDHIVDASFRTAHVASPDEYRRLRDLRMDERLWSCFKIYVLKHSIDEKKLPQGYQVKSSGVLTTGFLIDALEAFDKWYKGFDEKLTVQTNLYKYDDIVTKYVIDTPLVTPEFIENEYRLLPNYVFSDSTSIDDFQLESNVFNALENWYSSLVEKLYFQSFKDTQMKSVLDNDPELTKESVLLEDLKQVNLVNTSAQGNQYNFSGTGSQDGSQYL